MGRDDDDLGVARAEGSDVVTDLAHLTVADPCEWIRDEDDHRLVSLEVGERHAVAVLVDEFEVGSGGAYLGSHDRVLVWVMGTVPGSGGMG